MNTKQHTKTPWYKQKGTTVITCENGGNICAMSRGSTFVDGVDAAQAKAGA